MNWGIRILIFMAFGILFFYLSWHFENEYTERLRKTYKMSENIAIEKGVVNDIISRKGPVYITLTDKRKYRLPASINYQYKYSLISSFIKIGDIIYKHKTSDTLHILRGNNRYYFVLGKDINKN